MRHFITNSIAHTIAHMFRYSTTTYRTYILNKLALLLDINNNHNRIGPANLFREVWYRKLSISLCYCLLPDLLERIEWSNRLSIIFVIQRGITIRTQAEAPPLIRFRSRNLSALGFNVIQPSVRRDLHRNRRSNTLPYPILPPLLRHSVI